MEQQTRKQGAIRLSYVFTIGFTGGFLASLAAYAVHFLNFTPFGPGVILQYFPRQTETGWLGGPMGHLFSILVISLISVAIAFVYYYALRKIDTPWMGIWFGLALWIILFLGINPLVPGVRPVEKLGWNTNISLVCIFLLYGLFVGYSISYHAAEEEYSKAQAEERDA